MSNSLLWTPLAFGLLGLLLPKRLAGWWAVLGALSLRPAPDAVVIDTTSLDADAAFRRALEVVESARGRMTA